MKFLMMCVTIWLCMETTNSLRHYIGYDRPNYVNEETPPYHHTREMQSPRMSMMRTLPVGQIGLVEHKQDYYVPDHSVHLYGMPIYRGEWRATPYYYANGPSYNHYDDREALSNPLDDLHEEIIQENKQGHRADLLNEADDYEEYYEEPSESQRDVLTNNFLRNMIAYNRHKEMQQEQLALQQALAQKEVMAQKQALADEPEPERSDDDYFPDLGINPDEYQYEPKGDSNFDIKKYWESEMSARANAATATPSHNQWESSTDSRNDADVADELKSLPKQEPEDNSFEEYTIHPKADLQNEKISWTSHQQNSENNAPHHNDHDDDYSGFEYDDESWINWDRKRSAASSNRNRALEYKIRKRLSQTFRKDENGSKQSLALKSVPTSTARPVVVPKTFGQKERLFPDDKFSKSTEVDAAASKPNKIAMTTEKSHSQSSNGIDQSIYDTIKQIISIKQELKKTGSKKRKRYVPDEASLVNQLDSLRRIKN